MKIVDSKITEALRSAYAVEALPRLYADWSFRNFYSLGLDEDGECLLAVDNVLGEQEEGYDIESFPIDSIVLPQRPTKGLIRARVDHAIVSGGYGKNDAKFYLAGKDDKYKYWTSPVPTDASGNFPNHTDGQTVVRPYVYYESINQINKIVINLENTWASPESYQVKIVNSVLGTSWTTIATNPTIQNNGQIILYYNGTSWSSTKPSDLTPMAAVAGIMLKVDSLGPGKKNDGTTTTYRRYSTSGAYSQYNTDGNLSHFDLISMECHREVDLSDRLIDVSDQFDTGDSSHINPVGTLTTNTASISLENYDGVFNNENEFSPYYQMLLPDVEFTLSYEFNIDDEIEVVQQFNLFGGEWSGQRDENISVELRDASKFLEVAPSKVMWESLTVSEIAARLLDSVGFSKYNIETVDLSTDFTIPVFWTDGIKTVWEILDELALASQTVFYFDSFGVLQIKTRQAAFSPTNPVSYALNAVDVGDTLANIESLDQTDEFQSNHVTIPYKTTKWAEWNNGQPTMQIVWEPEGDVVLRATQLKKNLDMSDSKIWIKAKDAKFWPYSGYVNVQGEIFEYDGKEYVYYDANNNRQVVILKSHDDFKLYSSLSPSSSYKNVMTGALHISQKGAWNSEHKEHLVSRTHYSVRRISNGVRSIGVRGLYRKRGTSIAEMRGGGRLNSNQDMLIATRGTDDGTGYKVYGIKFKFLKSPKYRSQKLGIVFNNSGSDEDGYYINVTPTTKMSATERQQRNEVITYSSVGGVRKRLGGKGAEAAIVEERWYELEVYYYPGTDDRIDVFLDGRMVQSVNASGGEKHAANDKFGMFILGRTRAAFEYLYAQKSLKEAPANDATFFDRQADGFKGKMWDTEGVYNWRSEKRRVRRVWNKEKPKWAQRYFDDFGPWVQELREFEAKLDPSPVLHSRLFTTNDYNATTLEYTSTPFEAKWLMANTSRENAVLNGSDSLLFKAEGQEVDQTLVVLGRALVVDESENAIVKDSCSIKERGKVETELNSDWFQSKEMAEQVGAWIINHWGTGADEVKVSIFGNPLIELTDIVSINYPQKNMNPETHKYFVVGVSTSFDQGLTTELTLRRKN